MRVATFNIWNNKETWSIRRKAIIDEIIRINPDIIALQEVPNLKELEWILKEVGINHYSFMPYPDYDEGLAILSKFPLKESSTTIYVLN